MIVACLDLEGVLLPEIWIAVSKKTGIPELRLTTRDVPDYDALMKRRLAILKKNKITLRDIQSVIRTINPLPGAKKFLDDLRRETQVILLSDTYYEFSMPLMAKLGAPTLFCNTLKVNRAGYICGYVLRQRSGKEKSVRAMKRLNFTVRAAGDSYNDIAMLRAADEGIFYNPPPNIVKEHPEIPVAENYRELLRFLAK